MAILDFLTGNSRPMGGVVGQLAVDPRMNQPAKRGIMGDPDFAHSLSRLGANLMVAGAETDNTLGAIGRALGATMEANQADRIQNQQLDIMRAKAMPTQEGAFSGTGFDNQLARTQYDYYRSQGLNDLEARQRAANDVLGTKPQMQMVADSEGRPQLVATPRPTLPMGAMQQGGQSVMQAPDPIDQAAQAMGLQSGMLLPPPSGQGTPDMGMFQGAQPEQTLAAPMDIGVPQIGGPKTQQALSEAAGKAEIELQQKRQEGVIERRGEITTDIDAGYKAIQSLNQMMQATDEAFNSQFLPQSVKAGLVRTLGIDDPSLNRQLAATAQLGASRVEAFGPMLKELVGAGAVTEAERANAMEAVSKPNASPIEVKAIIGPLATKAQNRMRILELQKQNPNIDRKTAAAQLGIDWETGFSKGQTSADFLPQGGQPKVRRFNPTTGRLE